MFLIDQSLHTMASRSIPNPTQSIIATRNDHCPIVIKINRCHRVRVCREDLKALSRLHIPNAYSLIKRAGGKHVGVRIKIQAEHVISVSTESLNGGPGGDVPEADGAVVGGGGEQAGIGGESHVRDALNVALEFVVSNSRRGNGVRTNGLVSRGGCKEAAVIGEFDCGKGTFVARERVFELVGFERLSWLRHCVYVCTVRGF